VLLPVVLVVVILVSLTQPWYLILEFKRDKIPLERVTAMESITQLDNLSKSLVHVHPIATLSSRYNI
jgi:hypothetical protein